MSPHSSSLDPGPLARQLGVTHAHLERTRFADALWQRRLDVWSPDPATRQAIGERLGWLASLDVVQPMVARLEAFAGTVRAEFTDVVLLGMGGSSLAPEVMRRIVGVSAGFPRFRMLDSVDPAAVRDAMSHAATTLFVFASKSGSTIEPNVMAAEARRRVEDAGHPWGSRFIAITDEGTALHQRALANHFRDIFINPSDIGGRYSALSLFGLVPAALMGQPIAPMLTHARAMAEACRLADPRSNPGLALGAMLATAAQAGRDKLTLVVPPRLASFGLWVEQLVAESTGKQGKGIVPIVGEAPLAEYDGDRVAVVLELPGEHADLDVIDRLRASGAPVVTLRMSSVLALGAEFFRWEVATATAGFLLGINPFDQPNVQQAKEATGGLLAAFEANGSLPALAIDASFDDVHLTLSDAAREQLRGAGARAFLGTVGRGDYLGIMAYVSPGDAALAQVFEHFRSQAGALTRAATMFGYGPRYLHSTGQLHKGGPPNGVFVIISPVQSDDLAIPGERYSFGTLGAAQAYGDFASLNQAGRRALLLRVPSPNPSAIAQTLKGLLPPHIL